MTNALASLESKVTVEMNEKLSKPFTAEEVTKAIKKMHLDKVPSPNGMTLFFFQKFLHIAEHDDSNDVFGILNHGLNPKPPNHTDIVLIPNINTFDSPKDFRPIAGIIY